MGIGTFGSFTQARLAIYASQTGLTVTGNNISNVNTKGYTRQRLDQKSLYNAGSDRYYSTTGVKVGQGVLCYGLSQLRDPYLDIQYRSKSADVGAMDGLLDGLDRIAAVLDEVGKGGEIPEGKEFGIVAAQFREIFKALNSLTDQTGHDEYDVQVRSACDKLVTMLRSYGRGLDEVYDNTVQKFEQNVTKVNTLLTNIRNLNESIRQADIFGDDALEMRDERNLLIDELSEYIKIDVSYSMEKIGVGAEVEKLTIKLDNANPDSSVHTDETVLVDGIYAAQLSIDAVLNEKAYKYVEPDGTLTNNEARAELVPIENPNYKKDPADFVDGYPKDADVQYVKKAEDGTYVAAADADDADVAPKENPKYDKTGKNDDLLYLKADGETATATYEEAAHNPNFDITVSALRDRNDRLLYTIVRSDDITKPQDELKAEYEATNGKAQTSVDPATGDITITTVKEVLSDDIIRNPLWSKGSTTAYKYLTSSGTGTNDPQQAAKVYQYNPDFGKKEGDEGYDEDTAGFRYLLVKYDDADGNPLLNDDGTPQLDGVTNESSKAWIAKPNNGYQEQNISGYRYIKYESKDKAKPVVPDDYTNDLSKARGPSTYVKETYVKEASKEVTLDDNDLYGKLQSQRELLTEVGEFSTADTIANVDESALTKRGIPYYKKSLDLLAHTFATEMNKVNQGYLVNPNGEFLDPTKADGSTLPALVNPDPNAADKDKTYVLNRNDLWDEPTVKDPDDENTYVPKWVKEGPLKDFNSVEEYLAQPRTDDNGDPLKDADGNVIRTGAFVGGVLFSNNGNDNKTDDPPITASNISISLDWASGPMIVNSFVCPTGFSEPASSDSDNIINNFTKLAYQKLEFRPDTVTYEGVEGVRHETMFTGTLEDMWLNMGTVLGNDRTITTTKLDNYYDAQVNLDTSRDSVSAVDFNDEAMNLMMYAKAYNAACRLMTTIDSVLDKLINNTGLLT